MKLTRRSFLAAGVAGAASAGLPGFVKASAGENSEPSTVMPVSSAGGVKGRPKLCISTYSLQSFRRDPEGIEKSIVTAADFGIDAVDILHRSMPSEDNAYCQKLKQLAYRNGVELACLSIHQDFVDPKPEYRQRMVEHTIRCLELAYNMGIPAIRLNSGTWGTAGSFDNLMKARGIEAVIEGYTEDDGFGWVQDCIYKCIPTAEKCGVVMALENHWGIAGTPEGMIRIKNSVSSDWLKFLLDTGNFLENPYDKIEKIMPDCIFVSCKTYQGGGTWYSLDLDYDRIFKIFYDNNYRGYITLEFEGKAEPIQASIDSLNLFKKCLDKYYKDYPVK
ncbi:MAG: sugar phosphate isomerase/epimerase [Tannerellaceae bacterium]|jgi:sugar phosphate isomerase/epimerase|nr:sugar phosphate isomerase/epimerase [Tannerellaceae bacterium]